MYFSYKPFTSVAIFSIYRIQTGLIHTKTLAIATAFLWSELYQRNAQVLNPSVCCIANVIARQCVNKPSVSHRDKIGYIRALYDFDFFFIYPRHTHQSVYSIQNSRVLLHISEVYNSFNENKCMSRWFTYTGNDAISYWLEVLFSILCIVRVCSH